MCHFGSGWGKPLKPGQEVFWLYETDPAELRRRADELDKDGLRAIASDFRERASDIEAQKGGAACPTKPLKP